MKKRKTEPKKNTNHLPKEKPSFGEVIKKISKVKPQENKR